MKLTEAEREVIRKFAAAGGRNTAEQFSEAERVVIRKFAAAGGRARAKQLSATRRREIAQIGRRAVKTRYPMKPAADAAANTGETAA